MTNELKKQVKKLVPRKYCKKCDDWYHNAKDAESIRERGVCTQCRRGVPAI